MKRPDGYMVLYKQCWTTGKWFPVKIRIRDGQIMSKCFHSYIPKHYFDGWGYEIKLTNKRLIIGEKNPVFKNNWWKIIGYTKIQRKIVYFIWKQFYGWQKNEYWESPEAIKNNRRRKKWQRK